MKILMLGRWLPAPRRAGEGTREHRLARHLARSHRLTLAFTTDEANPVGPVSALREEFGDLEFAQVPRGWKCLSSALRLATGESCTMAYFRSAALTTRLADRMRASRYDLVYVSSSSMIQYALDVDARIPVVMDFGEVDSEWWAAQAALRAFPGAGFFRTEAARLRLGETAAARRAAHCVVASPQAARVLASFAPWASTTVVANGVDPEYFTPVLRLPPSPTVVFVSPLDSERAVSDAAGFAEIVVPAVRARVPAARFVVVGGRVVPSARRLAAIAGVEVVAPVADARPVLHRAAVAVAPLAPGHGLPAGVLEAMATGVPVVATALAADGLGARPGRDLHVEDDLAIFAGRVVELIDSPQRRAEMGAQGCAFVRAHYSWEGAGARLARILAGVIPAARSAGPRRVEPLAHADLG